MPVSRFRRIRSVPGNLASLAAVLLVVALAWAAAPFIAVKLFAFYNLQSAVETLGSFGDIFGSINALFSGFAFAALIAALLLQRTELQLQREELLETRRVFEKQSATLAKQNFESTFFSMLRLYQEIVGSVAIHSSEGSSGRSLRGRSVLKDLYRMLKESLQEGYPIPLLDKPDDQSALLEVIGKRYLSFQAEHESILGNYFRTLYNILKFIARSDVEDKRLYTNLVRAQLNSDELKLLFFNCLSPIGYEKFKPLVESFTILESVVDDEVITPRTRALYAPSAFTR